MQYCTRNSGEAGEFSCSRILLKPYRLHIQIIAVIFLSVVVLSCAWLQREETTSPFDARTWKEATLITERDTIRRPMARDLVQKGTLLQKSRAEVIQMLAQPQDTTLGPDTIFGLNQGQEAMYYMLGSLYSGESVALEIVLENDVVIRTRIWIP